MTQPAQTSAEARRRPLMQYVISRHEITLRAHGEPDRTIVSFRVHRSPGGSKPSHELIDRPELLGAGPSLERAREYVPPGFKRMDRRKDDRVDVVEVWV